MKVLIDMNLSPGWASYLCKRGFEAVHCSAVGDARAPDVALMAWAREHESVVLTRNLDFSTLLALTGSAGPSVLQLRSHDVLPDVLGEIVLRVLTEHAEAFAAGALATLNERGTRVRLLPLRPPAG